MKTTFISAAVLMLFAAGAARAEEGAKPCKADVEKFCKDVKPGEGRIVACLKAHEAELSADCKAKGMDRKGKGNGMGRAANGKGEGSMKQRPCAAETEKLCPGMKPGDGKLAACVKEHEKDFSDTCKANFAKRKGQMAKNNPCAADMQKFCKDVKPGEGRIMACMKTHEAELSDGCKARQAGAKERMGKRGEGRGGRMGRGNRGGKPATEPGNEPKSEEPAGD